MSGRKLCKSVGWVERSISGAKPIIRRVSDYSDLLYRLKFKDGRPGFVYFLLEAQACAQTLYRVAVVALQGADLGESPGARHRYRGAAADYSGGALSGRYTLAVWRDVPAVIPPAAPLAPYTPEFRYALCDLTGLADTDIRGAVLLRVTLWIMKPIADAQLAERLPKIVRLLRELSEKRTLLDYLETLLRYLTTATDKLSERDIGQALNEVLPLVGGKVYAHPGREMIGTRSAGGPCRDSNLDREMVGSR